MCDTYSQNVKYWCWGHPFDTKPYDYGFNLGAHVFICSPYCTVDPPQLLVGVGVSYNPLAHTSGAN